MIMNKDLPIKIANRYLSDNQVEVHEKFNVVLKVSVSGVFEVVIVFILFLIWFDTDFIPCNLRLRMNLRFRV